MADNGAFNEQFLDLFIFETGKYLDEVDGILLSNERKKSFTEENINDLFRVTHTIKSTAAMMGYDILSSFSHKLEDLFSAIRAMGSRAGGLDEKLFDLLFNSLEAMRQELKRSPGVEDGSESFEGLTLEIARITDAMSAETKKPQNADGGAALASLRVTLEPGCAMAGIRAFIICTQLRQICPELTSDPEDMENRPETADEILKNGFTVTFPAEHLEKMMRKASSELYVQRVENVERAENACADTDAALAREPAPSDGKSEAQRAPEEEKPAPPASQPAPSQPASPPPAQEEPSSSSSDVSQPEASSDKMINVYLSKLDKLQDITGELVIAESIAESAVLSCEGLSENAAAAITRLKKLTDVMRSVIMSLRMTQLSDLFRKMHRVTRDTARKLGKEVEFEADGTDNAADKRIIDELSDVLSHVVRNAITHGIESAEERAAMGKPAVGHIKMTARNTGNGIIITIADDGRGISLPLVIEAARRKGLPLKETANYTSGEILQLLMTSGLSTNQSVDQYSGRGVGLDAVRVAVKKLRGTITLETEEGRGTCFTISIPQTLAIMDCIKLEAAGSLYMLPVSDIYKIVVPENKNLLTLPDGTQRLLFKGFTIPLLRLDLLFGLPRGEQDFERGIIIVIEGEENACAVYADRLTGQQRAVIKPMPRFLRYFNTEQTGISGCTILGDGSISLIIDAEAMLARAEEMML
ncbi:MAG: chemotaxis protein CheA [Cloacibacillus sp.]